MRISVFLAGALVSGVAAIAQEAPPTPLIETGINYSFVRANPGGAYSAFSQNGGSGYIELNVNKVLGVVADFGGYYNGAINNFSVSNTTFSYMFGPRFNWRHSRYTPYVQALVGGTRLDTNFAPSVLAPPTSATQEVFALALGGGLDINLKGHLILKPIQVEYYMLQPSSGLAGLSYAQNDLRYSAGVAFGIGSR
jgi:hypothetical protein